MTLEELADAVGIVPVNLTKVIAGKTGLTFNQLQKIARFFGRGVLFFMEPGSVNAEIVHTPRMPEVAMDEVSHKVCDCVIWLHDVHCQKFPVNGAILREALRIKELLDISEDRYGGGVGENDLIIIATAKLHACELITDEKFQSTIPKLKSKYKIPLVCKLDSVNVPCLNFLEYPKRSENVFG